jgi:pyruvate kinase
MMEAGRAPGKEMLKTKIVCTLGPACRNVETLKKMALAGMDLARINCGHCKVEEVDEYIELVRQVSVAVSKRIGIMLDLQGPRLRVGPIKGGSTVLETGQEFVITTVLKRGDSTFASVPYEGLPKDLKAGDMVLIDDGLLRLVVKKIQGTEIKCEVLEGGSLTQGKGMNFPGTTLKLAAFTDRDRYYLEAGLKSGVDWIAQSFVRTAEDVRGLTAVMEEMGARVPVMAKIEKPEAVKNIDEILESADGMMEAEDVPLVQKELIKKAIRAALPVLTATQMLESMIYNPRPTRAEASDVANAILDGTDAVMLSAETSIGSFPVQVVEIMARIAAKTEQAIDYDAILEQRSRWSHRNSADAIGYAACKIAADVGARAIITLSRSGYTARLIARYRPRELILAMSPNEEVVDSMAILWGTKALLVPEHEEFDDLIDDASTVCIGAECIAPGDVVVITGGFLDEESSETNVVHVHTVR